ncbi:MAG: hypothetical protein ETSY2_43640 [Candidatus Entotheonella gemina]|uniref:Thiamine pyrophosphate enzyme TPP-binding domain-containing protein n=1 Tax=Candidatus Entotheonella gemina TaxID=1429439 RepID=W4LIK8_9BACT|nr:MAG: hypothetical protein ETSY2_43640 [Candidatus Entotheonella gemina]
MVEKQESLESPQEPAYGDGIAQHAPDVMRLALHIPGPNYAQLVEPFGGYGERVEDPTKLKQALQNALDALQAGRLALVDVVLDQ